jgi:hypothetical protein
MWRELVKKANLGYRAYPGNVLPGYTQADMNALNQYAEDTYYGQRKDLPSYPEHPNWYTSVQTPEQYSTPEAQDLISMHLMYSKGYDNPADPMGFSDKVRDYFTGEPSKGRASNLSMQKKYLKPARAYMKKYYSDSGWNKEASIKERQEILRRFQRDAISRKMSGFAVLVNNDGSGGNSIYYAPLNNKHNEAVKRARREHMRWERSQGIDPHHGKRIDKKAAAMLSLNQVLKKKKFNVYFDRPYGHKHGGDEFVGMTYPINYGNIKDAINPADGEKWDIVVPGPKAPLKQAVVDRIVGYVPVSNGNHKLIGLTKGQSSIDKAQVMEFVRRRQDQGAMDMSKHRIGNPVYF